MGQVGCCQMGAKPTQSFGRALAANSYDCDIQEGDDFTTLFKFEDFKKMIRPAITREATSADFDALFKRAVFIVNTKRFVYFRKAGVNDDKVPRRFAESADYLTEEGGKWYGKFKEHRKELPPNFEEEVRKEQAWLDLVHKKLSEKRDPKFKQRQQVRRLFRGPADEETCLEQMDKAESSRVAIKREIEEYTPHLSQNTENGRSLGGDSIYIYIYIYTYGSVSRVPSPPIPDGLVRPGPPPPRPALSCPPTARSKLQRGFVLSTTIPTLKVMHHPQSSLT